MRSCAIFVLNWNGVKQLADFIPSVLAAARRVPGTEVWVVDNDSKDGSAELCRERFPEVRFEALGVNKSLAGYNLAAERCDRDIIVSLDNDVLVDEDFLPPLLRHFDDPTSDVFAVTPQIRVYPPPATGSPELFAESTRVVWEKGMIRRGDMLPADLPATLFYNCGCTAARDRKKFLEIGGFDDLYFPLYHEDLDLSWRAWKRGWRCLYEPSTGVYHVCGSSLGRSEKVRTLMLRNEFLFHWKNLDDPAFRAAHWSALPARLFAAAMRRDRPRLRGFFQALGQMSAVRDRRRAARTLFRVSDAEVIRRINESQGAADGADRMASSHPAASAA